MIPEDAEQRALELSTHLIDRLAATDDLQQAWRAALQASLTVTQAPRGAVYVRAPNDSLGLVVDIDFATLPACFANYASMLKDPDLSEATFVSIGEPSPRPLAVVIVQCAPARELTARERGWVELFARQVAHLVQRSIDRRDILESEERFRSIFQESNDFIVTADLQQKITYCNPATAAALGWPADQIVGRSIAEFVSPPHFDRTSAMLEQKLREGGATRYEVDVTDRQGRHMTWEINSRLTFGADGKPTGLHAIGRDVTTMRRAHEALRDSERALREADQRKNEFLAMLAHELRNPLAPIRTAAQILRRGNADSGQIDQASTIVERQVGHITRIVDDLLDVSRVTRGLVTLDMQPTVLQEVIATAVEQVRPLIDRRQHRLDISVPDQVIVLSGESVRLVQMISNLLSNAARHSGTQGKIDLFVATTPQLVEIHVRDYGTGITPNLLPRVFDLFAQGPRSAARSEGGLGIGLALVRRLAELHGGHVEARSAGLGHGAEFTIVLPRLADDRVRDTAPAVRPRDIKHEPLQVLIVDDNQDAANMLATLLQMEGHSTHTEYAAQPALARAQAAPHDVMLLDIGLPDMNGYELAIRLRSLPHCARSVLIAITGYGQDEDRRRSTSAGFDHHLTKPVSSEDLTRVFAQIARQRS